MKNLRGLQSLQALGLRNASKVTDRGLAVLQNFQKLEWLDLYGLSQITDNGLQQIHGLKSLTNINLGACKRVTKKGVADLRHALPRLLHLSEPDRVLGPPVPGRLRPR